MTDKQIDQIIAGSIGFTSAILSTAFGGFMTRFWKWWDTRLSVRSKLRRHRLWLENTESASDASSELVSIKGTLLENHGLLERPHLRLFFDTWLKDEMLDSGENHSRLCAQATIPEEMNRLRKDAALLTE